jgi:hypothetical protein
MIPTPREIRAVDHAAQDVPTLSVGAEEECAAGGREVVRPLVTAVGIMGRDHRREDGRRHDQEDQEKPELKEPVLAKPDSEG